VYYNTLCLYVLQGAYYKRAQFIRRPGELQAVDHGALAVINVGGNRYTVPWSTLQQFPLTRLGRLRDGLSAEDIAGVCDDYDETRREFFFDRSPSAFRVILNFLAAGKLRLLRELCAVALHDELDYWGVAPGHMERCCRRRMIARVEEVAELARKEKEWRQRRRELKAPLEAEDGHQRLIAALREVMESPHSGLAGKVFAFLSIVMVAMTVVSLCISTMPDLREEETKVCILKEPC